LSCLRIAPALLRNTDEFFLTASNQIVKDLRSLASASSYGSPRRAPKLVPNPGPHMRTPAPGKLQNLKKNPTGRPYSAPHGGPHGVLLPFLTRGSWLARHRHPEWTHAPGAYHNRPSDFGDLFRIPETAPPCKSFVRNTSVSRYPRKNTT